ncbi:uncharacterized protein LOC134530011 isoform X2 [Bacillus rossius redtenbacheri]|uniref:uncharacterized protein LOC134530011 isoform X2 n=1 Tax=Bacillus rossius redtenbacheri TaxID=93214 RepID=UPI002FDE9183
MRRKRRLEQGPGDGDGGLPVKRARLAGDHHASSEQSGAVRANTAVPASCSAPAASRLETTQQAEDFGRRELPDEYHLGAPTLAGWQTPERRCLSPMDTSSRLERHSPASSSLGMEWSPQRQWWWQYPEDIIMEDAPIYLEAPGRGDLFAGGRCSPMDCSSPPRACPSAAVACGPEIEWSPQHVTSADRPDSATYRPGLQPTIEVIDLTSEPDDENTFQQSRRVPHRGQAIPPAVRPARLSQIEWSPQHVTSADRPDSATHRPGLQPTIEVIDLTSEPDDENTFQQSRRVPHRGQAPPPAVRPARLSQIEWSPQHVTSADRPDSATHRPGLQPTIEVIDLTSEPDDENTFQQSRRFPQRGQAPPPAAMTRTPLLN